ncbi:MAG: RsmB/NOP family class I SAM-dependent RNA methyltransferase [Flavobacteriales bacterium]|nr:RsmB/NOP family class I SAM-dependent RNA methyltransferase [Flavobacteriales bacterium]
MAKRSPREQAHIPLRLPASVSELLGAEAGSLVRALQEECPTSIRLNPLKPIAFAGTRVPWCANGRYLAERPIFTLDPLLHAGCYYVQEASSMLVEQAFQVTGLADRDILALDLCAAPGGKSTHLASLLSPGSLLVCNEPVPSRRQVLSENIWKQGRANTMITGNQPKEFSALGEFFDLVLVDAPCSGEGMFRKDPFARQQWNERLVSSCTRTQTDILEHAWSALRPGGWLIYSTCTWEQAENEEQIERLIEKGAEFVPLNCDEAWGVLENAHGHRCYQHRVKGEGLFIALIRKPGMAKDRDVTAVLPNSGNEVLGWIDPNSRSNTVEKNGELYASSLQWEPVITEMNALLNVTAPGVPIAEFKGANWRPHPALALNELLNKDAFATMELDREQALRFLRG